MSTTKEPQVIRRFLVLIEEYDEPQGYVNVKTVVGKDNIDDEDSVSQQLFNALQSHVEKIAEEINKMPQGVTVN